MHKVISKRIFFLPAILIFAVPFAYSDERSADSIQKAFLQNLADHNRVQPLETAGAHGISGWRIGAGLSTSSISEKGRGRLVEELRSESVQKLNSLTMPKFWFTKGLIYPFDIGVSFSGAQSGAPTHAGGYVHWAIYEAFAQPALALRGAYSKMFGLTSTQLETTSLSALCSWGIGMISAYLDMGFHQHEGHTKDNATMGFEQSFDATKKFKWTESTTSVGLALQILPPFVVLAFDATFSDRESRVYQGKISIGI